MEFYKVGIAANGLHYGWNWDGPYADTTLVFYLLDMMDGYTVSAPADGLNGNDGNILFGGAYVDVTVLAPYDDMESYTVSALLNGLNGGTMWTAGGYVDDWPHPIISLAATLSPPLGGNANFSASVTSNGNNPLTYQWLEDGSPLSNGGDISGVTTTTLTIANYVAATYDGHSFVIRVTDSLGQITNSSACVPTGVNAGAAWSARVQTNGGAAPSGGSITAVNDFVVGLSIDGIDSLVINANAFAPDSLIAAITPCIVNSGNTLWANHSFVLADLSVNGLKGDGSTKYLGTGVLPVTAGLSSTEGALAFYVYDKNTAAAKGDMGYGGTGSTDWLLIADYNSGGFHFFYDCYNNGTGRVTAAASGNGFYMGSRTAANATAGYFANSGTAWASIATGSGDGSTISNGAEVLCYRIDPSLGSTDARMSFACVAHGMTSAQGQALYNRVQTLRTAFGGGFR
jgi:hypothetical protein